jgi:ubiquinone/menaquinone biosynthesis C-methylase UbiE
LYIYTYHDFLASFGVGGAHPGGLSLTKEVLEHVTINKGSKILEVGCGTGQTAAYLAQTFGCDVTAIDKHLEMVKKARKRFEKGQLEVEVVEGDIEKLPFADDSFDFILAESVTIFADIFRAAHEYKRVLREGGRLIDLEMTTVSPLDKEACLEFQELYGINDIPTEQQWTEKFRKAGFHSVDILIEKQVMSEINEQPVELDPHLSKANIPEFDLSETIDPELYDIWMQHQMVTETYADRLKYNVYCVK